MHYSCRATTSNAEGRYAFGPMLPGELTIYPRARIRDAEGKEYSRDVRAVFAPRKIKLAEAPETVELTILAQPHKVLEFEWIDRRQPPGKVGYYDCFRVTGRFPQHASENPAYLDAETLAVVRNGRTFLFVKVPENLQDGELHLVEGNDGRLTYEDDRGRRRIVREEPKPGVVVHSRSLRIALDDIAASKRRVIYCDPPDAR